jgi:hypothetical protein
MLNYLKNCFKSTPVPTKEYVYSTVTHSLNAGFSTLSIEITATDTTVTEMHKLLTSTAYQLLADNVRTK